MARLILVATLLVFIFASLSAKVVRDRNNKDWRLVCYLGSWANYRHGDGEYKIEHIDVHLCTHLMYGFAKLENDKITVYDPYLDLPDNWGLNAYGRFNALKKQNPELSTIIAIGGWNEGSAKYSDMARDPARRKVFVQSVLDFLSEHGFDGLDMDWEYPANREGSRPEDKENFVQLLKELKAAFTPHGYLLTAAVAAGKSTMDTAYDIPQISQYLDFISLMTYDFHGAWEKFTGHNSPLYGRPDESADQQLLNTNYTVHYWLSHGAPAHKLVLGMALYGRCFRLANPAVNGLGAPVDGPGHPGPFTNEPGMIGFNEICAAQKREGGAWKISWSEHHQAPYASNGYQWCGYDDAKSIGIKVDYLKKMGLGGGMVWSLETADFRGRCFGAKYPLLSTIYHKLSGRIPPTFPPPSNHTEIIDVVTPPVNNCHSEGSFAYPGDCQRYYECIPSKGSFQIIQRRCPPGTAFDPKGKKCLHAHEVAGCGVVTERPIVSTKTHSNTTQQQFTVSPTQPRLNLTTIKVNTTHQPPINVTNTTLNLTTGAPVVVNLTTIKVNSTHQPPVNVTSTIHNLTTAAPVVVNFTTIQVNSTHQPPVNVTNTIHNLTTAAPVVVNSTTISPEQIICQVAGTFRHPRDCRKFYKCQKTNDGFKVNMFNCPKSLVFRTDILNCDYPKNVPECKEHQNTDPEPVFCGADGYYPFPGDCTRFVHCLNTRGEPVEMLEFKCPEGLYYQKHSHTCGWEKPKEC